MSPDKTIDAPNAQASQPSSGPAPSTHTSESPQIMSPDKTIDAPNAVPDADATGAHAQVGTLRGAWRSFRRQRLSYWSAIVFAVLFLLSLCA
ncbi:MAG: hypothetical protein K8963_11110, partial [Proteobacteria bacterium]|nr:hypothetical protein [Pseudomonadota bacterium]